MKETKNVTFEECLRQVFTGERECLHAPTEEVELGEVVLGTIGNPVAKAMFSFSSELMSGMEKFLRSLPDTESDVEKVRSLTARAEIMKMQHRCTWQIFTELMCEEFPQARDRSVQSAVRKDWQVVIFKRQPPSIFDLMDLSGL